ncbi:protein Wnt-10a [Anabrus simplex]|uniref:protein Wnt-10a n=1 Tax=Anabrus simplex TaxID=316456 RepID=UPI0035A343E1
MPQVRFSFSTLVGLRVNSSTPEQTAIVSNSVCKKFPGLTKEQMELCHPDVMAEAIQGLQLAVEECQYQFQWHRWNCSSLSTKNRNPHSSVLFQRGYRESAFAYAISAAGVAHNVARACSSGRLITCGCDPTSYRDKTGKRRSNTWKWGGCSHNMDYGVQFSKAFLDPREKAGDIQARINLHNNQAGRLAVSTNMVSKCKCHGMSGSCELRTCWKAAPHFRVVGHALKERFRSAVMVDQSNLGSGSLLLPARQRGKRRRRPRPSRPHDKSRQRQRQRPRQRPRRKPRALDLLYFQRSPSFCERDPSVDFPGTVGRRCNRSSTGVDSCSSLCCGRGYNTLRQRRTERCHCRFHWCCYVVCQNCTIEEWITVCK